MTEPEKVWSDSDIQTAVRDAIAWTPEVDAAAIGVSVKGGIVTLSGEVADYKTKLAAREAVVGIHQVGAMVDDVVVHPAWSSIVTEPDIARVVRSALARTALVPDSVKAEISRHDVTLTGFVESYPERRAAEQAVQHLAGVNFVDNRIVLAPHASASETTRRIHEAFARSAKTDADGIIVAVSDDTVTLTGTVRTPAQRGEAERVARTSPHVGKVVVDLSVQADT
ncbi:BON domain-containing protein [Williamsia sp.]|uniref:BON domain-containing protein n=1 Tax=Williamsia sp. TaxID=1872085 RepID=UPI001A2D8171|nr:BON domain-containing protein [Williamsia sp.]MBJ7287932.1 BON domain-containing protein [Williamsia sp.]